MKSKKDNFHISSSLQNKRKIHQKINDHIKGIIRQNNSALSEEKNMNAQKIPQKIIFKTKQTHKYLYKKSLINNKFQWLNKYIENSQLQSLSINIEPNHLSRNHMTDRLENKQNLQNHFYDKKSTFIRRSRTEAAHDQEDQNQFSLFHREKNFFCQRKSQPQNQLKHLQQISSNKKNISQKNFKLNRSKSLKDRKNIFDIANEDIKQNLLRQRNPIVSNRSNLMQKNFSISNDTEGKQNNKSHHLTKNRKNMNIYIDENTPAREFLESTARLNSSNLMFKNTSGYIKNRKRQYVYQSREQKRQQSQLLKMKRRFEEQITVEPWNPNGNFNENQNEENDFLMRNHR